MQRIDFIFGFHAFYEAGNTGGMIADTFQLDGDMDGRDDAAQVRGHGLLGGQNMQRFVFNSVAQIVYLLVGGNDGRGGSGIAL